VEQQSINYHQLDPAVEARAEELLARMTLAEKVGQLVQVTPFKPFDVAEFMARQKQAEESGVPFEFHPEPRPDLEDMIRSGQVGSLLNLPDPQLIDRLQRLAVEQSRMGIPLIVGADVIHGYRTVFPIPLAESCTWDPALLERAAKVAAEEASAAGIDWIFAPMVDVARDPRWGRVAEGAGEDVFLGSVMARARVRGFQAAGLASGRRVAACPKHYMGYGAAEAGRDYNTVDLSERTLRDVYLPPFQAAFEAGAGSVMSSFNEIGGLPATADPWLLRTILRDEWTWPGVVLSDYEAVRELIPHGLADDLRDAARLSMLAGLDMDMVSGAYANHLAELVETGAVPIALVDDAVRRVLRLKLGLGLFERWGVDAELAERIVLRDDFRALALQVAQQSIVLLKNAGGLLPLAPGGQRIVVIGPLADNRRDLLGAWAINGQPEDVETVLEGLHAHVSDDMLTHVPGCSIDGNDPADIPAALAAAQAADVLVLVLGESADMSGEAHSRAHLGLPGRQQELFDALAQPGKPIVVVLLSGRPLVIPRVVEQSSAVVAAWHGGIRAGRAIADVLFGATNPSGKLTAGWPRAEGQIPLYYAHKNTGRPAAGAGTKQFAEPFKSVYMDEPNSPLFPFGHGLSYTRFEYRELRVETAVVSTDGTLVVSAVIHNTGARAGAEVAQLYVRDLVGSVTRPVKELKGFQRIALEPGEARTVCFEVPVRQLGFWGPGMRYMVEPGAFKLWVGPDSQGGLEGEFEVRAG
jgi:beta-glucosidase